MHRTLIATLCVFALAGCALDEQPVHSHAEQAAETPFSQELSRALADNFVSSSEWNNRLAPLAQQLPRTASSDANRLALLWADQPARISSTVREPIRLVLHACGYPVPRTTSEPMLPGAVLIAENLTTPDADFEAVAAAAGVDPAATIKVAILDDGIVFTHPALAGHAITAPGALRQWDFVDNDATLPATDHGTAVASLAARGGQRVKILPLRIAVNAGIPNTLQFGQVVSAAIDTAVAEGVRVISMSYVTNRPTDLQLIRAAMARQPDTLFVIAAGNGNSQLGTGSLGPDQFLATMHVANVVVVANATRNGLRFAESFGGSNWGVPYVDVACAAWICRSRSPRAPTAAAAARRPRRRTWRRSRPGSGCSIRRSARARSRPCSSTPCSRRPRGPASSTPAASSIRPRRSAPPPSDDTSASRA
jgi:hypothetical protein